MFEYHIGPAADAAISEALRGIEIHGLFNSYHEAYAVTLEEMDEMWDEIKKGGSEPRDDASVYSEAIQVASCAIKIAAMAKLRIEAHDA